MAGRGHLESSWIFRSEGVVPASPPSRRLTCPDWTAGDTQAESLETLLWRQSSLSQPEANCEQFRQTWDESKPPYHVIRMSNFECGTTTSAVTLRLLEKAPFPLLLSPPGHWVHKKLWLMFQGHESTKSSVTSRKSPTPYSVSSPPACLINTWIGPCGNFWECCGYWRTTLTPHLQNTHTQR